MKPFCELPIDALFTGRKFYREVCVCRKVSENQALVVKEYGWVIDHTGMLFNTLPSTETWHVDGYIAKETDRGWVLLHDGVETDDEPFASKDDAMMSAQKFLVDDGKTFDTGIDTVFTVTLEVL